MLYPVAFAGLGVRSVSLRRVFGLGRVSGVVVLVAKEGGEEEAARAVSAPAAQQLTAAQTDLTLTNFIISRRKERRKGGRRVRDAITMLACAPPQFGMPNGID